MSGGRATVLLIAGLAVHVSSLLLPVLGFKCEAPQPFYSLECGVPGWVFVAFVMLNPGIGVGVWLVTGCWLLALLIALTALMRRLQGIGAGAAMAVLPLFALLQFLMPPTRWLAPAGAVLGGALLFLGALGRIRAARAAPRPMEVKSRVVCKSDSQ